MSHQTDKRPESPSGTDEDLHQIFPLFRRWRSIYLFVLGELVLTIFFFYFLSRAYA
jgi:hypothetical protein